MNRIIILLLILFTSSLLAQSERVYSLLPEFYGEDKVANLIEKDKSIDRYVEYLDELERQKYEIEIIDGVLYQQGRVYSSPVKRGRRGVAVSESIYVLSEDNKLYISHNQEKNIFHHSSFLSGGKVKAAGNIIVIDGVIASFDRRSGHYKPTVTSYFSLKGFLDLAGYQGYLLSTKEFQEAYNKGVKWMPMVVKLLNLRENPLLEEQYSSRFKCKKIYSI